VVLTGDFLLLRSQKLQTYFFEITTDSDLIIAEKYAIMRKRAAPHKDCASDAPSDFLSDCAKIVQAGFRLSKDFCAR
jgi:hypothetical protein